MHHHINVHRRKLREVKTHTKLNKTTLVTHKATTTCKIAVSTGEAATRAGSGLKAKMATDDFVILALSVPGYLGGRIPDTPPPPQALG